MDLTFIRVPSDCDCRMVITDFSQSVLWGNGWKYKHFHFHLGFSYICYILIDME
jgi:hypothetical protein